MSTKVVHGSLGVVCALGLAIVGVGWHAEERPKPPAPAQVYCDIDELMRYHPAWDQLVQVRGMLSYRDSGREERSGTAEVAPVEIPVPTASSAGGSVTRAALQLRLEQRAQAELAKLGEQLDASLARQLNEKRRELEAGAQAREAEIGRESEFDFAKELRQTGEQREFERVDAAIKLAALKAQFSSPGVDTTRVKSAIDTKEKELSTVRDELAQREDDLRKKVSSRFASVAEENRRAIEQELAELQRRESVRIKSVVRGQRERLHNDLAGVGAFTVDMDQAFSNETAQVGYGAARKAKMMRSEGVSKFGSAEVSSSESLNGFAKRLRERTRTELESVVKRIARENGLSVTFHPTSGAMNKTQWFRERLPYISESGAG